MGTTSVLTVDGVADFSGVEIRKAADDYVVTVTAGGDPLVGGTNSVDSSTFDVVPGEPDHLQVVPSQNPIVAGSQLNVHVYVVDEFDNLLDNFGHDLTLDIELVDATTSPDGEDEPGHYLGGGEGDGEYRFNDGHVRIDALYVLVNTGDTGSAHVTVSVESDADADFGQDATGIQGASVPLTILPRGADTMVFLDADGEPLDLEPLDGEEFQAGAALDTIRIGFVDRYGNRVTDVGGGRRRGAADLGW